MRANLKSALILTPVMLLSACVSVPEGPSIMALPGTGKSFDQFRGDDAACRQYANAQVGGTTPNQAAGSSFAGSAAVGTAIGAAAGAAVNQGNSVGVGAATGLVMGSAVGVNQANLSSYEMRRRYDHAYIQCMYVKGHRVPVYGNFVTQQPAYHSPSGVPPDYQPPPPPPRGYVLPVPPDALR
jgi:hypothetical protein